MGPTHSKVSRSPNATTFPFIVVIEAEIAEEDNGRTSGALSYSHIGSIGKDWQYGADIGFANSDQSEDDGSFSLRGSLYPFPNFEFGMEWSRQQHKLGFDMDSVEGFASWFAHDNTEITARYQQANHDTPLDGTLTTMSLVLA